MSSSDDSDFIPPSPDKFIPQIKAATTKLVETPVGLSKKKTLSVRSRDEVRLKLDGQANMKKYESVISDSEDDEDIQTSSANSSDVSARVVDESCILSSDLEVSAHSDILKPKKGFIKETPNSILHKEKSVLAASTPNFDPSTPVGRWRGPGRDSSLDEEDESPIVNPNRDKGKRFGIIDSDSEEESIIDSEEEEDSENEPSPDKSKKQILNIPTQSLSNGLLGSSGKTHRQIKERSIPGLESGATSPFQEHSEDSFKDANHTFNKSNSSSTSVIEADQADIGESSPNLEYSASKQPRNKPIYSQWEISPVCKDKEILNSNEDVQDASHASANISTSSVTSTKSLNTSAMTIDEIKSNLKSKKLIVKMANLNALPDKGLKLKNQIQELEEALSNFSMGSIKEDSSECDTSKDSVISVATDASSNISMESRSSSRPNTYASSPEIECIGDSRRGHQPPDPLRSLKEQLRAKQALYKASNPRALPDGGSKLRENISRLEREIMVAEFRRDKDLASGGKERSGSEPDVIKESAAPKYHQTKMVDGLQMAAMSKALSGTAGQKGYKLDQRLLEARYDTDKDYGARDYGGKLSEAREHNMLRMTTDAVQSLHETLKSMPDVEVEEEEQPRGLKVELMPHQRRALAWLLWRESQVCPGGILADDMGLGKTLTMLALLLKHKSMVENGDLIDDFAALGVGKEREEDSDDGDWLPRGGRKRGKDALMPSRGTLVVCPASLLGQWEGEAKKHISSKKLSVFVYHGNSRDISARRLTSYDLVVTTYQLVMREAFSGAVAKNLKKNCDNLPDIETHNQGLLFQIGWTRIILDEAHQIKNHKSKTSQAACMLKGARRWAVTGTPVQNKDMDLFSLVRFIRVAPFDDYTCWKHQLKSTSVHGMRKLNLLVRALLLRRTKDQVDQKTGEALVELPTKEVVQHKFSLGQEEREVYDRVFAFSRSSLIQYMKSQEEREKEKAEKLGMSFRPQFGLQSKNLASDKYTPTLQGDILKTDELKAHHMLVLLLRLRQICNHPALIRSIIEDEAKTADGLTDDAGSVKDSLEVDLITQMNEMSLREGIQDEEIDNRVKDTILNADNPVFKKRNRSSKIAKVIEELEVLEENDCYEKAVVVSQWTSMLEIVYKHLRKCGIETSAITGQIPVKDRGQIVNDFNREGRGPKVLLLSLAAGGVGLNLVGANHLFLLDMHWNPQMEAQACDRIYRVGQKRPVKIHRFVVENTVEEKILELQKKKIELADAVLTGAKRSLAAKLTLQDIQTLFSL